MKAVVLAAGIGKRMQPLTKQKPKALLELRGKPLLQHWLESVQRAGAKEVVVVIGYFGEKVKKKFGKRFGGMRLQYVVQRVSMGTAHALYKARGKAKGRFLVGYADVIVSPDLWKKLWKQKGFDAVVALRKEEKPERFGVALVEGKELHTIIEKPPGKIKSDLVNVGCYAFTEKIFPVLRKTKVSKRGEFELTDAVNSLAAKGRAGFVVHKGKCLDIGTLEDLHGCGKA